MYQTIEEDQRTYSEYDASTSIQDITNDNVGMNNFLTVKGYDKQLNKELADFRTSENCLHSPQGTPIMDKKVRYSQLFEQPKVGEM